eukprot:6001348-Amphidinium_carterae.1
MEGGDHNDPTTHKRVIIHLAEVHFAVVIEGIRYHPPLLPTGSTECAQKKLNGNTPTRRKQTKAMRRQDKEKVMNN